MTILIIQIIFVAIVGQQPAVLQRTICAMYTLDHHQDPFNEAQELHDNFWDLVRMSGT